MRAESAGCSFIFLAFFFFSGALRMGWALGHCKTEHFDFNFCIEG